MSLLSKGSLKKQLEFELYMTQNFPKTKWERNGSTLNFFESDWATPIVSLFSDDIDTLSNAGVDTINGERVYIHADAHNFFIDAKYAHIYNGSICDVKANVVSFDEKIGRVNVNAYTVNIEGNKKPIKVSGKAKIKCDICYFETDSIWLSRKIQKLKVDKSLNPLKELRIDSIDCKLLCVRSRKYYIYFSNYPRYKSTIIDRYADGWFSTDI